MCTLISVKKGNTFLYAMNRDINKQAAHSEEYFDGEIWYPVDPGSGGTWIGMNRSGTIAALLYYNITPAKYPAPGMKKSRGMIVPGLLRDEKFLPENMDLEIYPPFQLFYNRPAPLVYRWNGSELFCEDLSPEQLVLTSSSYGWAAIKKEWISEKLPSGDEIDVEYLKNFMRIHKPGDSMNMHICMHGEHSETTASTIIQIRERRADIYMAEGNPCESEFTLSRTLNLKTDE